MSGGGRGQVAFVTLATRITRLPLRRQLLMRVTQRHWAASAYQRLVKLRLKPVVHTASKIPRRAELAKEPFEEQMKRFNLIHFARWYVVRGLPAKEARANRNLLFFVSNFDRQVPEYVEAFVDVFGLGGLSTQWGDAPGWPVKDATVPKLVDFALWHDVGAKHSFKAYAAAGTNDVRSALLVDREVHRFAREARGETNPAWEARFIELLGRIQPCLGRIPRTVREHPSSADPNRRGSTQSFLLLAPFDREAADDVRDRIRSLDTIQPFPKVGGTHTARLAVLDRIWDHDDEDHRDLAHAYLMVSAEFQAPEQGLHDWRPCVEAYLRRVVAETADSGIWEPVADHASIEPSDVPALIAHLCRKRRFWERRGPLYKPTMQFLDYPDVSPDAVIGALETHRAFETFLTEQWAGDGQRVTPAGREAFGDLIDATGRPRG